MFQFIQEHKVEIHIKYRFGVTKTEYFLVYSKTQGGRTAYYIQGNPTRPNVFGFIQKHKVEEQPTIYRETPQDRMFLLYSSSTK